MKRQQSPESPKRKRRPSLPGPASPPKVVYGAPQAPAFRSVVVVVTLRPDAAAAVMALVQSHGLSRSGAAHHLIRLGAGLPPLSPLN
jgi:hypothetical protein